MATNNNKFLDSAGLKQVWDKIVATFVKKGELDTTLFEVVTELPTTGERNKVYLVATKDSDSTNKYAEYIYINEAWEKIGEFQSKVELTTSETKVSEEIPVAGGPLADLCNKAGITSISADTNLQSLLVSLFAKELWPSPVFTEGTVSSSIAQPNFSLSASGLVEVGTSVTASACAITAGSTVNATSRKYSGLTYGYSKTDSNTQESASTEIVVNPAAPKTTGLYGMVRTINGTSESPVSNATYSSVNIASKAFDVIEGTNTVKVEVTGAKHSVEYRAMPVYYACSNFKKTSEDHVTEAKDAKTITAASQPTNSKTITLTGVYPFYASTAQIGTLTKQTLQTSKEYNVVLVAETDSSKHQFAIPASKSISSIQMLNTLSGKYESYDISKFTTATQAMTVGGKSVNYTVYTRNDGKNGSATFKITLK